MGPAYSYNLQLNTLVHMYSICIRHAVGIRGYIPNPNILWEDYATENEIINSNFLPTKVFVGTICTSLFRLILLKTRLRRKKKYLWFRFRIVKKLGSVGRK
jgi:hypothetical protein